MIDAAINDYLMLMHSNRSLLLLCGCLFGILAAGSIRAEDFYIAEAAVGNGSGTSASNAKSVAWLNTSGNWASTKSSGKVGPGDTIRLVGTISTPLTVQASGSEGKPITIVFSKDARMSSPSWPGTGAIVITGKQHIVVDGGENGLIENTANGSPDVYPNSAGSVGVYGTNTKFLRITNLTIRNLYVRTTTADVKWGGYGVRIIPNTGYALQGLSISNCVISDVENGISINYRDNESSDIEISGNTISNVNHGIRIADANSNARCKDVRIFNNIVYGFSKWDEPATNKFHHNGVFCFATNSGSVLRGVKVYGNTIGSDFGKYSTSAIYFSGWIHESLIFNNVLLGDNGTPTNGLITLRLRGTGETSIHNNTFIGNGSWGRAIQLNGQDRGDRTVYAYNNLATKITFISVTFAPHWRIFADYNLGDNLISRREYSYSNDSTGSFKSPPQWQSIGYDLNGRYVTANLNSNHEPITGSPAIDSGKDLSAYFNTDKNGVIRPVGSGWDIGAYESLLGLTGISPIVDDSTQVVVDEPTPPATTTPPTTDVVIDFEEPVVTEPTPEPVVEDPVLVADSPTNTGGTDSTTETPASSEDTIQVVFNPTPSTETTPTTEPVIVADTSAPSSTTEPTPVETTVPPPTTSEPVIVADSSTSTSGSGTSSEPVSAGNTLEPPPASEPVLVADSSTSTEPSPSPETATSSPEPTAPTEPVTIVVVDSSTGTDSTDTSTDTTTKGKPGNGFGRETNGKITKTARIL